MLSKFEPADNYFKIIYTQGIAMGVGAGLVFVPSLLVLADQWGTHSMLAMGIARRADPARKGLFAGGTFFPTMLTQLLHNGVSFASTVRASSFVVLVMLLVANTCMRWACPRTSPLTGYTRTSVRELVTDAPYMCAVIGGVLMNWGIYFVYFYLQQFLMDRGIDRTFALYTPAILCSAAAAGGILANLAATKCGTVNVSTAMAVFCGILVTLPFIPSSIAGVTLCASIFGLFSGAWFSLLPPVIRTLSTNTRDCGCVTVSLQRLYLSRDCTCVLAYAWGSPLP
ncbi:hypothetical protein FA95DRAFT_1653328 [Auriscalpium vulgare]|uniref:Uncharacterized protein n=1 Tax=Auriscalpium vulgare TaxID=40419 RepID=A0ACB8R7B3_9AGAM|nr:hypothetical protein FA95DRAFT_1653328 [Auriscalpium vulgare]